MPFHKISTPGNSVKLQYFTQCWKRVLRLSRGLVILSWSQANKIKTETNWKSHAIKLQLKTNKIYYLPNIRLWYHDPTDDNTRIGHTPHHQHMTSLHGSHGRPRLMTIVTWLFCVLPLTTNSNGLNTFSGERPLYCVMPTGVWLVYVIRYSYLRVSCIYIVYYCISQVDSVMLVGKVNLPWEPCNDVMCWWCGVWPIRVSSSRGANLYFKRVFCFLCIFLCVLFSKHFFRLLSQ